MAKLRISLTQAIKKLEIPTRRRVTTSFVGSYKSVFKGSGLEFEGYRDYTAGDDARLIDWKASLRVGKTLMKEFEEERELNVFILIDVSSSMLFGTTQKLKNEYAAEVAASLSFAVLKAGDAVGFGLLSDTIVHKSFPLKDNKQFYLLLRSLTDIRNYGRGYKLRAALEYLFAHLKHGSTLIIISDFIGMEKDWEKILGVIKRKFDVIGIMVRDPCDRALPNTDMWVLVEDTFSEKQQLINPKIIGEKYRKYAAEQEENIKNAFMRIGAGFIPLSTAQDFSAPIINYFKRRAKGPL